MASIPILSENPIPSPWLPPKVSEPGLDNVYDCGSSVAPILPSSCGVVVVGGGLTGASLAYHLSNKHGVECVVLEARCLAGGATGRNGGHLWPASDEGYIGAFEKRTTKDLREFSANHQITCNMRACGSVWVGGEDTNAGVVTLSEEQVNKALGGVNFKGNGVLYPEGGSLWPAKLVLGLAQHATKAKFYTHVKVTSINRLLEGDGGEEGKILYEVMTTCGKVVAEHVVVATNAYAGALLPELLPYVQPTRNQVLLTTPAPLPTTATSTEISPNQNGHTQEPPQNNSLLPLAPPRLLQHAFAEFSGASEVYTIETTEGGLVLGGSRSLADNWERGVSDDGSLNPVISAALRKYLSDHWPHVGFSVTHEWAGIIGLTKDKFPVAGQLKSGVWATVGFNGHGMPRCYGVAEAIAGELVGRPMGDDVTRNFMKLCSPGRFGV